MADDTEHDTIKLVFLDIDGVANSSRSVVVKMGPTLVTSEKVRELARLDEADYANGIAGNQDMRHPDDALEYGVRFGLLTVDPICVELINQLLDQPGVGLVLSSTHRKFLCHSKVPFRSPEHLRRLRLYLTAMGFRVPELYFSATPVNHMGCRGDEIETWLNMAWENGIDVSEYVILDDAADMLPGQPLVRVDPEHGFSFSDYAKACRALALKEPGLILL